MNKKIITLVYSILQVEMLEVLHKNNNTEWMRIMENFDEAVCRALEVLGYGKNDG